MILIVVLVTWVLYGFATWVITFVEFLDFPEARPGLFDLAILVALAPVFAIYRYLEGASRK